VTSNAPCGPTWRRAAASASDGSDATSTVAKCFLATRSSNARALPAYELARRAAQFFPSTEGVDDAEDAIARGRALAGPDGALLVTGSLYLLADLS